MSRLRAITCLDSSDSPSRPAAIPAGRWRRYDPHTRWAVLAVLQLQEQLGDDPLLQADDGLVVATAYGAAVSTKRFVDSIAAYGDATASPTPFTTSVHNSTAGCLGEWLGLHGPCTTISQGMVSTTAALRWASLQLNAGRCARVLVIAGEALEDWSRRLVRTLQDCPWSQSEGMVALLMDRTEGRPLSWTPQSAAAQLDNGGLGANQARLQQSAGTAPRHCRPEQHGSWWPTSTLHWPDGLPAESLCIRETDGRQQTCCWLGTEI